MSERKPRVAMFGGTFNPVHIAHLRAAVEIRDALALDAVHMVPAHLPPHRSAPGVSSEDRLSMLKLALADTPGLIADDREIHRDGPSWSLDTLASLREQYGDQARLVMVLGRDAFLKLHEWHEPRALFDYAHILVIGRPESDEVQCSALEALIEGRRVDSTDALMAEPCGRVLDYERTTAMAISATAIRQTLARGESVRYLMPPAVEAFIEQHGLYTDEMS
ncbi:nicotinate-nucleotide adenylyltransferase [Kushneria sp. TE3]|uniref:nicotinate-nucleotide adenylyltransferase n=1 Tax=Kushneria sp. TE3 TaxID=3449832 RepID=UPI003F688D14